MENLAKALRETKIPNPIVKVTDLLDHDGIIKVGEKPYKSELSWTPMELFDTYELQLKKVQGDGHTDYVNVADNVIVLRNYGKSISIPMVYEIKHTRINEIYELSSSCLIKETSSSSPSMMLHQLVSLLLIDMLPGEFIFEDQLGTKKPDLIHDYSGMRGYVDITTENLEMKKKEYLFQMDYLLIVNKYFFNPLIREIIWLRKLSSDCDKKDNQILYDLVENQAKKVNARMLYSKKTLDYFTSSDMIDDDNTMLNECLNMLVNSDKVYMNEDNTNILAELYGQMIEMKGKISQEAKLVKNNYCFPMSSAYHELAMDVVAQYNDSFDISTYGAAPTLVTSDGALSYANLETAVENNFFFVKRDAVRVHPKSYEKYTSYPVERSKQRMITREELNSALRKYRTLGATMHYLESVAKRRAGYGSQIDVSKDYIHLMAYNNSSHEVPESEPELLPFSLMIDPDHMVLLKSRAIPIKIIKFLSVNRDFNEARFKKKVVSAIKIRHKDGTKLHVPHWAMDTMHAELLISGLIFSDEKGVIYVSYFVMDKLYRTELWRLSDLENNETLPERMLGLVLSTVSMYDKYPCYFHFLSTCFRLMMENSWGSSRWLKPLRYLSSGVCMGSNLLIQTLKKVKNEMREEDFNRRSIYLLFNALTHPSKNGDIAPDKTLFFSFDFRDLGYECFLYDLCPKRTYGRKRHLKNAMQDMIDEVALYNQNFNSISLLYQDFEDIIEIKSSTVRKHRWYEHLKKINILGSTSGNRFTFSPASIVLLMPRIKQLCNKRNNQGSVPALSSLMTAKASFCSIKAEPLMACESISNLSKIENTVSTTRLAIRILSRPVDLIMRMFDKPQVGGNREISILSAPFRVLQSILESYSRQIATASATDILDRENKFQILSESMTECLMSKEKLILTADQTRWGPNFSTVVFGLMLLSTGRFTTEYYIPALSCLLCEFKAFELPIWIPDLFVQCDTLYTIPGVLGRSHMGQGIFHRASSLYHSLVLDTFSDNMMLTMNKLGSSINDIVIQKFCTSDDMIMLAYLQSLRSSKVPDKERIAQMRYEMSKLPSFLVFFCIKTSDYKNLLSKSKGEMNSWYFSNEGLGSNDLKFINSLIEPQTSANFLRDMQQPYFSYDSALNSGCSRQVAESIFYCNYLVKMRQWKIKTSMIGLPRSERIKFGLPSITKQDPNNMEWINFPTSNHFKRRKTLISTQAATTYNTLTSLVSKSTLTSISESVAQSTFRNMIVRQPRSTMFISPLIEKLNTIGISRITYDALLHNFNDDFNFIQNLLVNSTQPHMIQVSVKHHKKIQMFGVIKLKASYVELMNPMTYALSVIETSDSLSSGFTNQQFISHVFRKEPKYDHLDLIGKINTDSFEEAYADAQAIIQDFSLSGGSVYETVSVNTEQIIEFDQLVKMPNSLPFNLETSIQIRYGVPEIDLNFDARYVSSETTYADYCMINPIDICLSSVDHHFLSLPAKRMPNTSDLRYKLKQISWSAEVYSDMAKLALYEFMFQASNGAAKLILGKPSVVFLNYSINIATTTYLSDEHLTDNLNMYKGEIEETMTFASSHLDEFQSHITEPKKLIKKDVMSDLNLDDLITEEMKITFMKTFKMVTEDEEENVTDNVNLLTFVNEEDDFYMFKPKFSEFIPDIKLAEKKIERKSVCIDWHYILFSNTYSLRRAIFLTYMTELMEAGVILSDFSDPLIAAERERPCLILDKNLSKNLNRLINTTMSKFVQTSKADFNLLNKVRQDDKSFNFKDLGKIPFAYSISGKPKHLVVSRDEFNNDYDEVKILV
jgi:hypothetical protein